MSAVGNVSRVLTLVLALAAVAAQPSAAASRDKLFSVEVTGIHHVDWSYQSAGAHGECDTWSTGSGTQTTGFSQPRPARYTVIPQLRGVRRGSPAAFWVMTVEGASKVTVGRTVGGWTDHLPPGRCTPCEQEGGCDGPVADPPAPAPIATDCRRRTLPALILTMYYPDGDAPSDDVVAPLRRRPPALQVQLSSSIGTIFSRCYPDLHDGLRIATPDPPAMTIAKAGRVARLRRDGRLTLRASSERETRVLDGEPTVRDACAPTVAGPGYVECAVTEVTVRIRRIR